MKTKKIITHKELAVLVQRKITQNFGTRRACAEALGISESHLRAQMRGASPFCKEVLELMKHQKASGYCRK